MLTWRRFKITAILIVTALVILSYIFLGIPTSSSKALRTLSLFQLRRRSLAVETFVVDSGHTEKKRRRLPNLEKLTWPERECLLFPVGAPVTRQLPFKAQCSRGQMRTLWKLFNLFANVMEELSFSDRWMLYGGSLLGSFRHHDIIPWDDDLDVLVDKEVRPALWKKMRTLMPNYTIQESGQRDKICAKLIMPANTLLDVEGSRKLSTYDWSWPSVDIGYYISNVTHITEVARSYGRSYSYPKSDVFPLLLRPFYKTWVPTPRNTFAFTLQTYPGSLKCTSLTWSHAYETGLAGRTLPCVDLSKRYAFVERNPLFNLVQVDDEGLEQLDWVREKLVRGGKVIHEISLVSPRGEAYIDTYMLHKKLNP
ncbi:unnamed protein product [Dibothriocephalus latus]|uniref:LicD/FKTN/FKRP nucleotidyltransferase domain-containing protein n=1 Tax=Dibothriocephalus latus TaxID=60516 RepID=A0A3P7L6P0_DIBLA|nr:unnamed protein product [Dibothriocephalus latus]